jgi:hypothetical protein
VQAQAGLPNTCNNRHHRQKCKYEMSPVRRPIIQRGTGREKRTHANEDQPLSPMITYLKRWLYDMLDRGFAASNRDRLYWFNNREAGIRVDSILWGCGATL